MGRDCPLPECPEKKRYKDIYMYVVAFTAGLNVFYLFINLLSQLHYS